jgi:hypothetical protein
MSPLGCARGRRGGYLESNISQSLDTLFLGSHVWETITFLDLLFDETVGFILAVVERSQAPLVGGKDLCRDERMVRLREEGDGEGGRWWSDIRLQLSNFITEIVPDDS